MEEDTKPQTPSKSSKIRIKQNLLSCKDTREEKEFHPQYFSIYRKSSESIQKVRSRRNHLSEDDSKAA